MNINKYVVPFFLIIFIAYNTENIVLCKICVALVFYLCIRKGFQEKSYINPYFLFSVTPLSLLVYVNFGTAYMVDITAKTYVLAIINMLAFVYALSYTSPFTKISNCISLLDNKTLIFNAFFLYALSLLARVIPPLASILSLLSIPAIVCAMKTRKKSMFLFVVAMFLISALGITSKTEMLTYSIALLVCYDKYYATTLKQKRLIAVVAAMGVIFMIFSFTFANKGNDRDGLGVEYYEKQGITWNYESGLFMPYMYLTNGWTNLQYVTETQDNRTYGLWTIAPLLGYTGLKENFSKQLELQAYSSFNTFSFIGVAFKDYGYWLSVLMSIMIGVYVKKIYTRFLISRSPLDIACYVLVALATLEMFFSNHFFMQSYPFTILILMELYKKFCIKKNNRIRIK